MPSSLNGKTINRKAKESKGDAVNLSVLVTEEIADAHLFRREQENNGPIDLRAQGLYNLINAFQKECCAHRHTKTYKMCLRSAHMLSYRTVS